MATHLRVLSESYPISLGFQQSLCPCALDESSLGIGRVKMHIGSVTNACLFDSA